MQDLYAFIFILGTIGFFIIYKKDLSLPENSKFKKGVLASLILVMLISIVGIIFTPHTTTTKNGKNEPQNGKLQSQIKEKDEQVTLMAEKVRISVEEARQSKAENELYTKNVLSLQEELLRRNDEFNLLKEELDLRYKIDANKLLRENEGKIRTSAKAEAQRLLEEQQLKARVNVAKTDIESKVVSNWTPPKDKHNLTVVIKYILDNNGKVMSVETIQKSGSTEVDNSVIEAVHKSAPFKMVDEEPVRIAVKTMVSKFVLP